MSERRVIDELYFTAAEMRGRGVLPRTVIGVAEDEFALREIAINEPRQLQGDLIESQIINHDMIQSDAERTTAQLKLKLLESLADDIAEGDIFDEEGNPLTAEQFTERRQHDETFAAALKERAVEERIADEAASLEKFSTTRAAETAVYTMNESVRILNARVLLGRRAAVAVAGLAGVAGSSAGITIAEIATDPQPILAAASAFLGLVAGGLTGGSFSERVSRRSAKHRAQHILSEQAS